MNISNDGIKFIARYETADGKPNLTAIKSPEQPKNGKTKYEIGFGHNSDSYYTVTADSKITEEQAYAILEHDINEAVSLVNNYLRKYSIAERINQHQFDALISAAFNGIPVYDSKCGLSKAIIENNADKIEKEWGRWIYMTVKGKKVKSWGLVRRRADEIELYFCGDYKRDYR